MCVCVCVCVFVFIIAIIIGSIVPVVHVMIIIVITNLNTVFKIAIQACVTSAVIIPHSHPFPFLQPFSPVPDGDIDLGGP